MPTPAASQTQRDTQATIAMSARIMLTIIVIAYLLIAMLYATRTPAWQIPDEPAHYNYIRHIVENRALPVLELGDYDQAFNEQFTNPANTPNLSIDPLRYEFHQPPLYYLLATPIYAFTNGDLVALRFVSVLFGGALIIIAYLIVREFLPARPLLALGVAAFVAFIPQHVAMMAGVNNDALAELLLALILFQMIRVLKHTENNTRGLIVLGVLIGLGFITKTTDYLAVPVVFVALLFRDGTLSLRPSSAVMRRLAVVFIPAIAIGALWWLRNISIYGGLDILGLARHNAVVVGQPLTSTWIARMGFGSFFSGALTTTFHSFWGQFGWMGVVMPDTFYLALGILSVAALLGFLLTLVRPRPLDTPTPPHSFRLLTRSVYVLLILLTLSTFSTYVWYNFTFVQHQGRYLFPALIPLGLLFAIGIERWSRLLPARIGMVAYALVFIALAALDVYALFRFIIPALAA